MPEKSLLTLKNIMGKEFDNLTKDEVVSLVAAHEEGQITSTRLQILLNKNSIEVNKALNTLLNKKLIEIEGQGRGTRYLLSDIFDKSKYLDPNNKINSINKDGNSINSEISSINKDGNSINSEISSINKDGNSINNHDNINEKLINIAKEIANKKELM